METVSAWAKAGAWALESEQQESLAQQQQQQDKENGRFLDSSHPTQKQPLSDFPSLEAAATTAKSLKKKKSQPLSLAEFTNGKQVTHGSAKFMPSSVGLTQDEMLLLPTGPRERTQEELERSPSRFNGGFHSYGLGSRKTLSNDQPRRNSNNNNNNNNNCPSRADEIDDWGAVKKFSMFERRDRVGFLDSPSRADESDSWVSNKSHVPSSEGRRGFEGFRERRGGFRESGGVDSDSWGRKRDDLMPSDLWGRKGEEEVNGDVDSDTWVRKKEEGKDVRPRLLLQARTLPVSDGHQLQVSGRSKGLNPFGEARPREEVLAEKGQDWKKIDEQLESMVIKDMNPSALPSLGKKSFGAGNRQTSLPEDCTERNWRKSDCVASVTTRAENGNEVASDS